MASSIASLDPPPEPGKAGCKPREERAEDRDEGLQLLQPSGGAQADYGFDAQQERATPSPRRFREG